MSDLYHVLKSIEYSNYKYIDWKAWNVILHVLISLNQGNNSNDHGISTMIEYDVHDQQQDTTITNNIEQISKDDEYIADFVLKYENIKTAYANTNDFNQNSNNNDNDTTSGGNGTTTNVNHIQLEVLVQKILLILLKRFMSKNNLIQVWVDILSNNNNNDIELMVHDSMQLLHHYRIIWNHYKTSTISLFHSHHYLVLMMKAMITGLSYNQQLIDNIQHVLKKMSKTELVIFLYELYSSSDHSGDSSGHCDSSYSSNGIVSSNGDAYKYFMTCMDSKYEVMMYLQVLLQHINDHHQNGKDNRKVTIDDKCIKYDYDNNHAGLIDMMKLKDIISHSINISLTQLSINDIIDILIINNIHYYHRYITVLIITSIPTQYIIYVIDSIGNIWSDVSFINTNNKNKQTFYTDILLLLLHTNISATDNNNNNNSIGGSSSSSSMISRAQLQIIGSRNVPIETTLLYGISNYIDVDINETRRCGMLIAQCISKVIGSDEILFKEYVDVNKEIDLLYSSICSGRSRRNIGGDSSSCGDDEIVNNNIAKNFTSGNIEKDNIAKHHHINKHGQYHDNNNKNYDNGDKDGDDSDSDESIVGYQIDVDPSSIYSNRSKDRILITSYLRDCLTSKSSFIHPYHIMHSFTFDYINQYFQFDHINYDNVI